MRDVLFVENSFWRSQATRELKDSLQMSAGKLGIRLLVRGNADFVARDAWSSLPGHVLFWDKDLRLAQRMEEEGLRLTNSAESIRLCDDKTLTYLYLRGRGIPMPDTILCPLTYAAVGYTDTGFLKHAADSLGLPFVVKEGNGSFGQQVYLVHSVEEAQLLLNHIGGGPLLFQRFVAESAGHDLRLYVVGGKVVAAIKRQNLQGDFRANISGGGTAFQHSPGREERALALKACSLLGLDFGGVDLLLSDEGPLLCEVNSNAHFRALKELSGVNPADHIMALLREKMT